jgi:hypothetical protein
MQRYQFTGHLSPLPPGVKLPLQLSGEVYLPADVDAHVERLEEALQRIVQWADAYPLDVFPEPNFKKVNKALKAAGLSLDCVSASNMRHAIKGAGDIARSALGKGAGE